MGNLILRLRKVGDADKFKFRDKNSVKFQPKYDSVRVKHCVELHRSNLWDVDVRGEIT